MGGATTKRKDNPIKLMKIESKELGKYGDPIGQKICGVQADSIQLLTRLHQWRIERCAVNTEQAERRSAKPPEWERQRPRGRICGAAALEFSVNMSIINNR